MQTDIYKLRWNNIVGFPLLVKMILVGSPAPQPQGSANVSGITIETYLIPTLLPTRKLKQQERWKVPICARLVLYVLLYVII